MAGGDWIDFVNTGTMGFLDGSGGKPSLGFASGTVAMTYTANLGLATYEGVSGCFIDVDILTQRDYIVECTVVWRWASANWAITMYGLWANGSPTGIFPPLSPIGWRDEIRNASANTTLVKVKSFFWILPNWKPGRYRLQLVHSPDNSSEDRAIIKASMVCM